MSVSQTQCQDRQCLSANGNTNNISSANVPWIFLYTPSLIYSSMQIGLDRFAVYSCTYTVNFNVSVATNP